MPSDLRFIPHTSQRHPIKLPPHCRSDRFPQRRFPNPGWTMETKDRALHIPSQLSHRQLLQYSCLDLLHSIMVIIQLMPSTANVDVVCRRDSPGKRADGFNISPYDIVFNILRLHPSKPIELVLEVLPGLWGQLDTVKFDLKVVNRTHTGSTSTLVRIRLLKLPLQFLIQALTNLRRELMRRYRGIQ